MTFVAGRWKPFTSSHHIHKSSKVSGFFSFQLYIWIIALREKRAIEFIKEIKKTTHMVWKPWTGKKFKWVWDFLRD